VCGKWWVLLGVCVFYFGFERVLLLLGWFWFVVGCVVGCVVVYGVLSLVCGWGGVVWGWCVLGVVCCCVWVGVWFVVWVCVGGWWVDFWLWGVDLCYLCWVVVVFVYVGVLIVLLGVCGSCCGCSGICF
jgi:hypothetical protein